MNSANVQFGVIIVGILAGIFLNNRAVERLEDRISKSEDRINSRFNALDARTDRIFSEFGTFHSIQGEHKAKLEELEKKR